MPYVGRDLQRGNYLKLDDISSSFDGSTTTFNLTSGGNAFFPGSAFSIIVSLGGVIQEPESAFQIDKSQIIFAAAPSPNDDFFCIVQGVALGVGVPGHNTVNNDQLAKPLSYGDYFRWDSANNRVGINTLLPSTALDVVGNATFSGNVSIGGTLTYEDVANIDAVGIITARAGIEDKTLTAGRVVYTGTGGRLVDNSGLTFNPTTLGVPGLSVAGVTTFTQKINLSDNFIRNCRGFNTGNEQARIVVKAGDNSAGGGLRIVEYYNDDTTLFSSEIANFYTTGIELKENVSITNDIDVDGHTNLDNVSVSGATTCTGGAVFMNSISLNASTNNYLYFNDNLNFTRNGHGNEMTIDSSGRLLIGTTTEGLATYGEDLTIASSDHAGITLRTGTGHKGTVYFSDGTSGDSEYRGSIQYDHSDDSLRLAAGGSERLRISSAGHLQLNGGTIYGDDSAAPTFTLQNTSGNNNHCRIVLGSNVGSDNGGIEFWTAGSSAATKKFSIRGNNNYIEVIGTNTLRFDDGKLNINHNSSNAYIRNTTGQLLYRSATHTFENAAGSTEYFRITSQGLLVGGSDSYNNTTLGTNAGDSFTGPGDAKFNTLIGKDAGTAINSGDYNTSVGCFALDAVTSGQSNTAVGYAALSNCTGQNNVGLGDLAGQGLTSSTGVVAIGEQTLNGSSSSNYMVAIGYQALYTSGTVANTIAIGFRAAYNNTSGSTNQIIGRNAAKGTGAWTGDYNTIIGDEACVDCSGSFNNCMAIGRLALKKVQSSSTTMNSLIAIGNQALQEHDGSGNHSTGGYTMAIGHSALQNMRHIRHCTIVGSNAAYQWNPTSAQQSIHEGGITALGAQAMYNHRSGGSNIAIGRDCNKGPNNSSAGTGNNNISIGTRAAELMTSGAKNISIGDLAGFRIETGYGNVQIGWLANYAYDTTNSTTNGYENTLVGGYTRTLGYNTYKECILGYGAVGKGTRRFFVNCDNGVYHGGNTSSWDTTSDERIKKNIVDNIIGLDKIEKIKVKNFEYRTKDELTDFPENMRDSVVVDKEGTQLGVIAQEINEILPDVVDKNEDGNGAWTVNPDNITWYLVNAVKELSAEVKALKAQINS